MEAKRQYRILYDELVRLSDRVEQAAKRAFPVGVSVTYMHGEHRRKGVVLWNSYGRVRLRTPHGKEVVIECNRLLP